ncbi:MAG TPA: hypothetical protein VIL36_03430 [Acidimicrobiales bacterium]
MEPDRTHCVDCDRRLDEPEPESDETVVSRGLRRCPACQADLGAYLEAVGRPASASPPSFRGAVRLEVPLPGWPTDVTLVGLTVWDRCSELDLLDVPGPHPPPPHSRGIGNVFGSQPPHKWTITSDTGTVHHGGPWGGGTRGADGLLAWHVTIAPSLPADARRIEVRAVAPGASASTVVELAARPLTHRRVVVEPAAPWPDVDPDCPSCGPPPGSDPPKDPAAAELCHTCRSTLDALIAAKVLQRSGPDRVMALGADLGALFDAQVAIPVLTQWSTWFDVTVVGHHAGGWAEASGLPRAGRWAAHDDVGHRYVGACVGGATSPDLVRTDLSFVPALAPEATTLTVEFPPSFDGRHHQVPLPLPVPPAG